jgi:Tol biopolymer transport system component
LALCLVMVGNGVRPQLAEAQQGQTRTLVCSGADCDGWISPDGKSVLAVVNGDLLLREMATNKVRRLADAAGVTLCCAPFSPDGSRVAYSRYAAPGTDKPGSAELIVSGADGTKARMVHRDAIARAWSADGKRLLIGQLEAGKPAYLAWLDIGTGAIQKLATFANWYLAKASPDGRYIAVGATKDDKSENVYIIASDGSSETLVSPSAAEQRPVEWTADGKYLVFAQVGTTVDLWMARITGGKPQGSATNTHVTLQKGESLRGVDRSGAVYYRTLSSTSDIYTATMDPSTGKVTSAPVPVPVGRTGGNVLPRWAPDSRRLAYIWAQPVAATGASDIHELSVYSFDTRKEERAATQAKLTAGGTCWSRDGKSILFNIADAPRQPQPARYTLDTNQVTPLFPGATPFLIRSCASELTAGFDKAGIKVRSLSNGSEKEIHQFGPNPGVVLPVLSHDGRSVAFVSASAGASMLRVISSDGGSMRELASASAPMELQPLWGAAWSPDDRYVYFARQPDEKSAYELFRVPVAGGPAESMGLKVEDLRDLDIAPDGTRIAFSIGAVSRPEIWAIKGFLPGK